MSQSSSAKGSTCQLSHSNSSDVAATTSIGTRESIGTIRRRSANWTDVNYATLQHATENFNPSLEIGDGGSARVFKAYVKGVPCAIKLISRAYERNFAREVNTLTQIRHDNICCLYASTMNGPQLCLVLELMDIALDKRLVLEPKLSVNQRVWIALGICRGLAYLHSLSPALVHRDIKSQNGNANFETVLYRCKTTLTV
jgi:serine/threonine protein kinase